MDVRERFAANLRRQRKALGLPQDKFADLVGLHRTYISDIERLRRNPTIMVVDQIARALKITIGELLD